MKAHLNIGVVALGGDYWAGGREYSKNLVSAAVECSRESTERVRLKVFGGNRQLVDDIVNRSGDCVDRVIINSESSRKPVRFGRILHAIGLHKETNPLEVAIDSEPVDFVYPVDRYRGKRTVRHATWIPDFQHIALPQFFASGEINERNARLEKLAESKTKIVLSSNAAFLDLRSVGICSLNPTAILRFRVDYPKELLSTDPLDSVRKYNLSTTFALVSNQFWAHKNHLGLFNAIKLARKSVADIQIVMTGSLADHRDSGYMNRVLSSIHELGIAENVRLLGLVPKHDQMQLLRASRFVLQPSLFEGWSTCVEESHCLGKSILLSDIPVHREQDPPHAVWFDPASCEDFAEKLVLLWNKQDIVASRDSELCSWNAYRRLFVRFGRDFVDLAKS